MDPLQNPNDSLETEDSSSLEAPEAQPVPASSQPAAEVPAAAPKRRLLPKLLRHFNPYLLLFIMLLIVAGGIAIAAYDANNRANKPSIQTTSLSSSALKQLADSDVTVGQPKQVLNVQSNAVFAGKVLVRDSLEVAGPIQVGGTMSLPGITVAGNSQFDQVQVNKTLAVAGDTALQGQLSVQKGLSVAGKGAFNGPLSAPQLTVNSLQLAGDLNLTHHITAGGPTPGRSGGSALGSGGSASISGSDTAGSININTGSGAGAGCFVTVTFVQRFNSTPHVLVTPIGSAAAGLAYYVNRSADSFSVCTASSPPSGTSFGFDYFVLD